MANVTAQSHLMYQTGDCQRTVLVSVRNTTAGDTVDVSAWMSDVKLAGIVSATGTTIAQITTIATGATGFPTLLTMPTGPSSDGIWLIAVGVAA